MERSAPAVDLFLAAAERVGAAAVQDLATVAQVCEQLDGLPLSIELAAAQLGYLTLDELADRLDRRFELLARRRGGRERRHASLLGVLEDSWMMLNPEEQMLLMQMAAFPSEFTVDDLEAVTVELDMASPSRTLGGLVDRGLVTHGTGGRRRLLETVKLYAREQCRRLDDPNVFLESHTQWILRHLGSYSAEDRFVSYEMLAWADQRYDDRRAAEDRLVATERFDEMTELISALTFHYFKTTGSRSSAAIERIDTYLGTVALDEHARGLLSLTKAHASVSARRFELVHDASVQAERSLRTWGEKEELAAALIFCSFATVFTDRDVAVPILDEAAAVADDAGAIAIADHANSFQAFALVAGRDFEGAALILDDVRGRQRERTFDESWNISYTVEVVMNVTRDPALALTVASAYKQDIERAWSHRPNWAAWHGSFAKCAAVAANGDVDATRELLVECQRAAQDARSSDGLPDLLLPHAALAWARGELSRASRWLTAVRHSTTPTFDFMSRAIYRQLRDEVGLQQQNPLETATIGQVYAEATNWTGALDI